MNCEFNTSSLTLSISETYLMEGNSQPFNSKHGTGSGVLQTGSMWMQLDPEKIRLVSCVRWTRCWSNFIQWLSFLRNKSMVLIIRWWYPRSEENPRGNWSQGMEISWPKLGDVSSGVLRTPKVAFGSCQGLQRWSIPGSLQVDPCRNDSRYWFIKAEMKKNLYHARHAPT